MEFKDGLPGSTKDLIKAMVVVNSKQRISVESALSHPFFKGGSI